MISICETFALQECGVLTHYTHDTQSVFTFQEKDNDISTTVLFVSYHYSVQLAAGCKCIHIIFISERK